MTTPSRPVRRRIRHLECQGVTVLTAQTAEILTENPAAAGDYTFRCLSCGRNAEPSDYRWISDQGADEEPVGTVPEPAAGAEHDDEWCGPGHACHRAILHELAAIRAQLTSITTEEDDIMTAQDDINRAITVENTVLADLAAQTQNISDAQTKLLQEIATLQAGGVDTSGLTAVSDQLTAAQQALDTQVSSLQTAAGTSTPPPAAPSA